MKKMRRLAITSLFLGLIVVLSACSMKLAQLTPGTPVADPILYSEDFTGYSVKHLVTDEDGWDVRNESGEDVLGVLKVIADDGTDSKRALQVLANEVAGQFNFFTPPWDFKGLNPDEVNTIAFEFKVNWKQGTGMNLYIYGAQGPDGPDKIVLSVDRSLRFSDGSWIKLGDYTDGWNTVRVIASKDKQETEFYLNGEHVGTGAFRRPVTSWDGSKFRFLVVTSESETKEILYGDLKAWVVD